MTAASAMSLSVALLAGAWPLWTPLASSPTAAAWRWCLPFSACRWRRLQAGRRSGPGCRASTAADVGDQGHGLEAGAAARAPVDAPDALAVRRRRRAQPNLPNHHLPLVEPSPHAPVMRHAKRKSQTRPAKSGNQRPAPSVMLPWAAWGAGPAAGPGSGVSRGSERGRGSISASLLCQA